MLVQMKIRRGTASEWSTSNPILSDGELGYEKDTQKLKVGNGTAAWNDLAYSFAGSSTVNLVQASGYTSTPTAAGTTTLTANSSLIQVFTGTTTQNVNLPVTSTLALGWTFTIINNSTNSVTVRSSGANNILVLSASQTGKFVCIGTTLTTAADWVGIHTGSTTYTGTGSNVLATSPTFATSVVGGASMAVFNTTSTTVNAFGAATTMTIGGTSTATATASFMANATASGSTKTVNIGTAGAAGSTTNINIGSAVGTTAVSNINLSGKIIRPATSSNVAAWTTSGQALDIASATFTDTSTAAAGTVASRVATSIQIPTFASTNAITVTGASTFYIAGAPTAGTNTTITNPYALNINAGNVRIGEFTTAGVVANSASGVLSTTTAPVLTQIIAGAGEVTAPITATTYTLASNDTFMTFNGTATCTVTLGTATAGRMLLMKTIAAFTVVSASSNVIPRNSGTAGTAILPATAGAWALLVGDGTNWVVMAGS